VRKTRSAPVARGRRNRRACQALPPVGGDCTRFGTVIPGRYLGFCGVSMPSENSSDEPLARLRIVFVRFSLGGSARDHNQEYPYPVVDRVLRPTTSRGRSWDGADPQRSTLTVHFGLGAAGRPSARLSPASGRANGQHSADSVEKLAREWGERDLSPCLSRHPKVPP
jgi:hypothetical protein